MPFQRHKIRLSKHPFFIRRVQSIYISRLLTVPHRYVVDQFVQVGRLLSPLLRSPKPHTAPLWPFRPLRPRRPLRAPDLLLGGRRRGLRVSSLRRRTDRSPSAAFRTAGHDWSRGVPGGVFSCFLGRETPRVGWLDQGDQSFCSSLFNGSVGGFTWFCVLVVSLGFRHPNPETLGLWKHVSWVFETSPGC